MRDALSDENQAEITPVRPMQLGFVKRREEWVVVLV
jgi:hypothetical protein